MKLIPITLKKANDAVSAWHRHNKPVRGCRFCLGAESEDGSMLGVVIIGRPVARMVDQHKTAEITRLCVRADAPKNTCSFLYAAARRAWAAMGGERVITYTLESESGSSLRGAGWKPTAQIIGEQWTRSKRVREVQGIFNLNKTRWEASA